MRYSDYHVVALLRQHLPPATPSELGHGLGVIRRTKPKGPDLRKFTGRIHGRRRCVDMPLVLPGGSLGTLKTARAGQLIAKTGMIAKETGDRIELLTHEGQVSTVAAALGRLKRGIKERPSAAKAAAALRNCNLPPKPGKRPRGRPRKDYKPPPTPAQQLILRKMALDGLRGEARMRMAGLIDKLQHAEREAAAKVAGR